MVVCENDILLNNVSRIIEFGVKSRIIFSKRRSAVCDSRSLSVENTGINTHPVKEILKYWKEISRYARIANENLNQGTFLKKQFDNLSFVSPNNVLRDYLHGEQPRVAAAADFNTIYPFKFNLSQKEALENALRSQVSIIEGPPGTGKTQTILNILANLVMQNKSVAVVAGNNAAVQNVRDKLEARGYHFLVAALGRKEIKDQFFANLPYQYISH